MNIQERMMRLSADNARLRSSVDRLCSRFSETEQGDYLALDDGELDGPYTDVLEAARLCAADGCGCTVIHVGERFDAQDEDESEPEYEPGHETVIPVFNADGELSPILRELGAERSVGGGFSVAAGWM